MKLKNRKTRIKELEKLEAYLVVYSASCGFHRLESVLDTLDQVRADLQALREAN